MDLLNRVIFKKYTFFYIRLYRNALSKNSTWGSRTGGFADVESEAVSDGRPITTSGHVNRVKGLVKGKSVQNLPKSSQEMALSRSTPNFRPGTESKSRGAKRNAYVDEEPQPDLPGALPESTAITVGLLRIADIISRKVLPWQAAFCPRAVEHLREASLCG